ncbi:MAG: transporter substrate-binding domain-containing protein [Clostridia bacterium]|nr:transporter substrate-binding domain-containing protein [Clostridia bacterium]MDE7215831.1 transporter substrate-binding domain-containing protein [Clostridia bacterium]
MKKKIIVAALLCSLVLVSVFAFAGCQKYLDYETLQGYDVDLAKAVAKELGVEVKFLEIKWKNKIIELKSGNIDFAWNGMTILEDLKKEMEITDPYMNNAQVCVVKKENADKYNTLDAIKDAKFVYESGSAGEDIATENGYKGTDVESQMIAMTDVLSGSSDIAIVDLLLANFYSTSHSSFSDLTYTVTLTEETYGIGAKKGNVGAIDKLCSAIMKLQEDGTVDEIAKKYGVEDQIIKLNYTSKWDSLSDEEKAGWNKIEERGYFVVGCTIFAPMAYEG